MTPRLDRLLLGAAVAVVLTGYIGVFRPAETAIAERYALLDDERAQLDERLASARHARTMRDEERALAAWIRRRGLRDGRPVITARFLRELAATASADAVHVTAIAGDASDAPVVRNASTAAVDLDDVGLTVSLRGSYAHLMRAVRDLGRGDVAARVGIDALSTADRSAARTPALIAVVHVLLLRWSPGDDHDAAD